MQKNFVKHKEVLEWKNDDQKKVRQLKLTKMSNSIAALLNVTFPILSPVSPYRTGSHDNFQIYCNAGLFFEIYPITSIFFVLFLTFHKKNTRPFPQPISNNPFSFLRFYYQPFYQPDMFISLFVFLIINQLCVTKLFRSAYLLPTLLPTNMLLHDKPFPFFITSLAV
jgi:hypothetical protein